MFNLFKKNQKKNENYDDSNKKEKILNDISKIQSDMISVCSEYANHKADFVYLYIELTESTMTSNYFFGIENKIYENNMINNHMNFTDIDVSVSRQKAVMDILISDLFKLRKLFKEMKKAPTVLKLTFSKKDNRFSGDWLYIAEKDIIENNYYQNWFDELSK